MRETLNKLEIDTVKITFEQSGNSNIIITNNTEDFTLDEFIKFVIVPMLLSAGYSYKDIEEYLLNVDQ